MDTYNPNKLTAKTPKSALTLRELADIDESAGNRNRVDNVRDNQILVSLSKFNRPKTFSFRYISDILLGGNGVTISTDKDGITSISNTGVTKIIAGTNISVSPVSGLGNVTINSTGGGGGATPTGYYGAWQDNVTQTAAVSNVGYPMIFRTIDLANGISIVTNGTNLTRITFANTGVYNLQFSSQFQNTDSQEHDVTIWLRFNGVDVPGSSGFLGVPPKHGSVNGHCVVSWNYLLDVTAGKYYELVWSTTNATHVTMQFYAAGSPPPSAASVILTVTQQSGIMAGTGITAINSLTGAAQTLVTNGSGTDFNIASVGTTHTFNLPTASAANRGALSSADWTTFNNKQAALVSGTNIKTINSTTLLGSGNIAVQPTLVSGTNIKTVNGRTILGSGNVATGFQYTVVGVSPPTAGQAVFNYDEDGYPFQLLLNHTTGDGTNIGNYLMANPQSIAWLQIFDSSGNYGLVSLSFTSNVGAYSIYNANLNSNSSGYPLFFFGLAYFNFDISNPALVSGTTIKTINGNSVLGSGNLVVAGGVTSVTGTAPVVSSGGTTPAISMAVATTSADGYLTSTNFNTFNNKQAALVSGTNIKTINSTSLLGSGNLVVGLFTLTQSVAGSVITSGTPVASLVATIPANTVGSSGTIEFISKFFGAGGTGTAYLYVNTSNTIVGASLLATGTTTFPATGFGMLARTMNYNGGNIRTLSAGSFFPSDYTSQPISFVGFDPAVTNYFFFAVSGGPAYCNSYRITIY